MRLVQFIRSAAGLAAGAVIAVGLSGPQAEAAPKSGGILKFVVPDEPPSFDGHRETTFALIHPIAPFYSLLIRVPPGQPYKSGEFECDLCTEMPKPTDDGKTYTFKLKQGVKFHDGTPLTAHDIVATYKKIIFPPEGTTSARVAFYVMVESVSAPDDETVVFKLKHPSAAFVANLASPWNVIFPKKDLDKDPDHFKTNVIGSGPFKFKSYVRGATFEGERNPDYFVKDRPYLDGYKFYISPETSVRAAALRSGRAHIEFRGMPNSEVEAIKKQLGDKVVVQEAPTPGWWAVSFNNTVKPFDDVRVRKALTLAIDRHTMSKVLFQLTGLRDVGGLVRPGTQWAMSPAELEKLPGFGRDIEKSRAEAKKLLAEAGHPNGLKFTMINRNVKLPYQDFAVYFIQEWRKIGVEVENRPLETAAWFDTGRQTKNYEAIVDPHVDFMDEPDLTLADYISNNPVGNWSNNSDPELDDLYQRQARTLDPAERKKLVNQFERIVFEKAYFAQGLWWVRSIVHSSKVKNWVAAPSHYSNQKLQDVWLSED